VRLGQGLACARGARHTAGAGSHGAWGVCTPRECGSWQGTTREGLDAEGAAETTRPCARAHTCGRGADSNPFSTVFFENNCGAKPPSNKYINQKEELIRLVLFDRETLQIFELKSTKVQIAKL
jgi:hypothetical protein